MSNCYEKWQRAVFSMLAGKNIAKSKFVPTSWSLKFNNFCF